MTESAAQILVTGVGRWARLPVQMVLELGVVSKVHATAGTGHHLLMKVSPAVLQYFVSVTTRKLAT